jgi:methyl-accepting chemotaxis protein
MGMNLKLGTRITLGFGCMLAIVLVLSVVSIYSLFCIKAEMAKSSLSTQKMEIIKDIKQSMQIISKNTRGAIIFANDPTALAQTDNETAAARDVLYKGQDTLKKLPMSGEERRSLKSYVDDAPKNRVYNEQVVGLIKEKKFAEAAKVLSQYSDPMMQAGISKLNKFNDIAEAQRKRAEDNMQRTYETTFEVLAILVMVCITLGIIISLAITRSITKPVNKIASSLSDSSNQVAGASNQLSTSAQQLSQGSSEQASSLEEISSTLQESASMLQQNNSNTKQAALLSGRATEFANKGNNEMQEMMNSIQEIKKSSDQISKIIKVIDDIAFQTNILALNAAIEAARAGEAGMGFAVVAEEVRNLAGRSAQAAKDTTVIIESNIELSGKGVAVAEKVREALVEITGQAGKVNELMNEIAAASNEQAQGIDQVNKAMFQMESVTQQNAASAEESASASEELNAQAESMRKIVRELSELVNGAEKTFNLNDHLVHHSAHIKQPVKEIGNTQQNIIFQDTIQNNRRLTDKTKTKVISPEDVIPLEKDPNKF